MIFLLNFRDCHQIKLLMSQVAQLIVRGTAKLYSLHLQTEQKEKIQFKSHKKIFFMGRGIIF